MATACWVLLAVVVLASAAPAPAAPRPELQDAYSAPVQTHMFNLTALEALRAALQSGQADAATAGLYSAVVHAALEYTVDNGTWSFSRGPWSVLNKTLKLPPSASSRHEYVSIGIYNHPCNDLPSKCEPYPGGHLLPPSKCDNKTGLPWEPCDGLRNLEAIAEGDAPRHDKVQNAMATLGQAVFYCNETAATCDKFEVKAAQVLRTWFLDEATSMLPDLYYGQIKPSTDIKPGHGGFIEWSQSMELLDCIVLFELGVRRSRELSPMGPAGGWTPQDSAALRDWFAAFLSYTEGPYGQGERRMTNNHGTWFDVTWQSVALFVGNESAAHAAADEVIKTRIPYQILPDGREWIELERSNPAGYCQYNLAALTCNAALAANSYVGLDLWSFETADGRSIRKAVDWLLPYALGVTPWPYKQIEPPSWGGMASTMRRAANGFRNRSYEVAVCKLHGSTKAYQAAAQNLLEPALFADISC